MEIVKRESLQNSRVRVEALVSSEEMTRIGETVIAEIKEEITLPGFRKGKAPENMVLNHVGKDGVREKILNKVLPQVMDYIVTEGRDKPIEPPHVHVLEMSEGRPLKLSLEFDVLPEVKLGDYKKIKISAKKEKASDKIVKDGIESLRRNKAKVAATERAAKKGDILEINFSGSINGEKKPQLSSENYPLVLGDGKLIPGFEDQLLGLKRGQEKTFKLTAPKGMPKEFLGKEIEFKVSVLEVKEMELPELNADFALSFGKKDVPELEADVRNLIQNKINEDLEYAADEEFGQEILKITKTEVPASLINNEAQKRMDEIEERAAKTGLSFENYLSVIKQTKESLFESLLKTSEQQLKLALAISEIAKRENVEADEKTNLLRKVRLAIRG